MKTMQKCFTYTVVVTIICSLAFVQVISRNDFGTDMNYSQPSLEDDTVFGNYTADRTHTFYNWANPNVRIDVYDLDGIDSVWLTYRRANETSVLNRSMDIAVLGNWNSYVGSFRVNVSPNENEFIVQFHANDSLGHQTSSIEYSLVIYYNPPNPPDGSIDPNLIIGVSIAIVVSVGLFYMWRKGLIVINE